MKQLQLDLVGTGGYTQEQIDKFLKGFTQLDFGVPDEWCHCDRCEYGRAVAAVKNNDPSFNQVAFAVQTLNGTCRAFTKRMIEQMRIHESDDPFSCLAVLRYGVLK